MKKPLICLLALLPLLADASYYGLTRDTKDAQQCITFDVRYPYWTNGIYIATYPGLSRSKEGWNAPYYGGIVSEKRGDSQLIQFASWQMGGKDAPGSGIDFVHAGPHMSWVRSTWEGSSGGIKGKWPNNEFKPGQWYRFFHRVWTPVTPVPHLGYAGVWMKSLETGVWYHLATFKFPAELTGFNSMGGFNEYFTANASDTVAEEFRNSYAMRNGVWGSEAEFTDFNHKEDIIKLTPSADGSSVTLETTRTPKDPPTRKYTEVPVVHQKIKLNQPDTPIFFDRPGIMKPSAEWAGNRLVVRWSVDVKSAPQLGYLVEVLDGDKEIGAVAENEPEARQCVVDLRGPATGPLKVRLLLTDIFGTATRQVVVPVESAKQLAACDAIAAVPGLAYRYYESPAANEWNALPSFAALTSKREGVVATPDISPRLKRTGYAFDFSGFLTVPEDGLYGFNLISACGAKLIIDGQTVIDADGYHSINNAAGAVALKAGPHKLGLPYYQGRPQMQQADDFLQLSWSGPRFTTTPVPATALRRALTPGEPTVVLTAKPQGAGGINLALTTKVVTGAHKVDHIEYYATNTGFDYYSAQGASGIEYLLAENTNPAAVTPAVIWGGPKRSLRARLVYDGNRTVDSSPIALASAPEPPATGDAMKLSVLEHHLYPPAYSNDNGVLTLVGESTTLLTKPFAGNGVLTAHLADITPDAAQPDGTTPQDASNWFAGIILRDNLNPRPGEPLGGAQIPFSAVLGTSNHMTRHCDSTMINGAGNQPSGDVGGVCRWYRIERKDADFITSISKDGNTWTVIMTVNLPKMSATLEAGFIIYSNPSATPRVHWARFDHISLTK